MGQKVIYVDDLTGQEITEGEMKALEVTIDGKTAKWEVGPNTFGAFTALISGGDLATFVSRMKPYVKLAASGGDSSLIRAWARNPENKAKYDLPNVSEKGAVPADVVAKYREATKDRPPAPVAGGAT